MLSKRVIPVLLLKGEGLVKTINFKNPKYIGDPINAVKLFNDKEVDELAFLDIEASKLGKEPNYKLIENIASEAFMPLSYGGNITSVEQVRQLIGIGVEKVIVNSNNFTQPTLITDLANRFGSSTVVACIDVKKTIFGKYELCSHNATKTHKGNVIEYCKELEKRGAGELLVNNADRDGKMAGYDINLMHDIAQNLNIPVIACGGAGNLQHIQELNTKTNVAAFAAGSIFVFHGPHKAVLINYPTQQALSSLLN
jgi:imidazole glycerol-phosphate synthase subunit HisF